MPQALLFNKPIPLTVNYIMPIILRDTDKNFEKSLSDMLAASSSIEDSVQNVVSNIISEVRKNGDIAVAEYTQKFDRLDIDKSSLKVDEDRIEAIASSCDKSVVEALRIAAERIRAYHEKQMPLDFEYQDEIGFELGWRWNAIKSVGLYVPGGTASYPSSVLMNAIPAKVAGVKRLAMVVPTPDGEVNPAIFAAAKIAGVTEIYRIGGAQAIAALAYGTESISPVDKIVGPGNQYVAEAKRQVYGKVGIDSIAGPTDVVIIADTSANPKWIASDLLAQAEHGITSRAVLITDSDTIATQVEQNINSLLLTLNRAEIARKSWEKNGIIIIVEKLEDAASISNLIAPEHLEIMTENPDNIAKHITNAGAIFSGYYSAEAIGDYIAGPSHVLPTEGTARFSSGLSVYDFLKKSSLISCSKTTFQKLAPYAIEIAKSEGLDAHALSLKIRSEE